MGMLMVWMMASAVPNASAHASLEQRIPEANARLEQSPPFVALTFNEPIDPGVGSLEVLDSKSRKVTAGDPELSSNKTELKLALPALDDDVYTVTYRIVSEDGHPVSGSYVFVVGSPPEWKDGSTFEGSLQAGSGSSSTGQQSSNWLMYIVRAVYYCALLLAAGVTAWSVLFREPGESVHKVFRRLALIAVRSLLLSVLVLVFLQAREVMAGQPLGKWITLFTETSIGRAWLELIVLSLVGFILPKLGKYVQLLWVVLLVAVESLIGHPAANDPKLLTIAFDFVHLLAAAIWAGGLVVLLVLWNADRKEAGRFGASFSQGALISLIALVISGVIMTLLFLPKLSYLWLTTWGGLLVVKTILVVVVLVTGTLLRMRMRANGMPEGKLLRADAVFMVSIVVIAAIFTYISPLPDNEPYNYHQMGEDLHLTLDVTPNVPGGDNTFNLQIWLPEELGEAKSVVLRLHSEERKDVPIDVPLEKIDDQSYNSFPGYIRTTYQSKGPFLPYASKWTAEIRVMDQEDNETVKETSFQNY